MELITVIWSRWPVLPLAVRPAAADAPERRFPYTLAAPGRAMTLEPASDSSESSERVLAAETNGTGARICPARWRRCARTSDKGRTREAWFVP